MSDIQRDREERQHVIEVLKSWDGYFIGYTSDEVQEALRYAIASIETDLRYDLLYEETSGQADNQADKPITKNCESCRYYGPHHKVCNYCYKCSLWTEQEPTTKNSLGVDAISRQAVLNTLDNMDSALDEDRTVETYKELLKECYKILPSVTPQEPKFIAKSDGTIEQIKNCNGCVFRKEWEKIGKLLSVVLEKQTEQEPKTGHWIPIYQGDEIIDYRCSECEFGNTFGRGTFGMDFCPRCGADMREVVEK